MNSHEKERGLKESYEYEISSHEKEIILQSLIQSKTSLNNFIIGSKDPPEFLATLQAIQTALETFLEKETVHMDYNKN
jgi:hypothetical protein